MTTPGQATRPEGISVEFFQRNEQDAARYVSDTTVREETLQNGRFIGIYWSASGQTERVIGPGRGEGSRSLDPRVYPSDAFELEIDGQLLNTQWEWVAAYERPAGRPGTVEAVVELKHRARPISVKVVTRLDGTLILVRWLEISNAGTAPAALAHVSSCSGVLWQPLRSWNPSLSPDTPSFSLGYLRSELRSEEGDFSWVDLPQESYRIERTQGTNYGPPYFILRNNISGELFFAGLAWSRNWFAEFTHKASLSIRQNELGAEYVNALSFRTGPLGPAPLRVIAPGETVSSPEVHIGPVHAGFDTAIQAWQKHMCASVVPARAKGREMFSITGHVVEYVGDWLLREIDIAAEMGSGAFVVDAGWYGDVFGQWTERRGDWYAGDWLPGGMDGVRNYCHRKGMLFGLWMEPEQAGDKSKILEQHPDWLLRTADGRPVTSDHTYCLNLANEEAATYVEDSIVRVIRDYQLDFLKIDYNVRVHEGGQALHNGYLEQESWRHCEVMYGIFDRVRREFPNVVLETCAGGGGRNDLGMLSRFHYGCESDLSWFPRSIRAINGLGLFLPPEAIGYYHNHVMHAHQTADLDTHLRVTLFANTVFVGFGDQSADHTSAHYQAIKRYVELAKTFCYPIIAGHPLVYHHTPGIGVSRPATWCVLEYAANDRRRGYAGVFSLSAGQQTDEDQAYVFRPRGLDPALDYEVRLDNNRQVFVMSGKELARDGIAVRLDAALTSELLLFDAVAK